MLNNGQKAHITKLIKAHGLENFDVRAQLDSWPDVHYDELMGFLSRFKEDKVSKPKQEDKEALEEAQKLRVLQRKLLEAQENVRVMKNQYKTDLINENIKETIKEEIAKNCTPIPALPKQPVRPASSGVIEEDLVILLSDEHGDQVVKPHKVNGLEDYNFQVVLNRAENFVNRVIQFTKHTLNNYRFNNVYILCLGDHVNGEIHGGTESSTFRNSFANAMAVGQLHALMFRDIASHFDNVKVIYVPGNHGRTTPHKDYQNALRNLDYVVAETAFAYSKDIKNIEFLIPDAFTVNIDINGFTFNMCHGDDIKGHNGIPWYGIERRNRRLQAIHAARAQQIHYKVMGHFHQASTMQDTSGETIINGSWKATDEYLYNSLGAYTKPCQWVFGVHEKYGVSWRMGVHLRDDNDTTRKSRYSINLGGHKI